jgi:8-oxo-dGTP pyrophosphatase MutT (NUDIX family)
VLTNEGAGKKLDFWWGKRMTKRVRILYDAAGGVITNAEGNQVLLLIRPSRDEVRLPKGHIEPGETPEETAIREVIEEAGYNDVGIIADLGKQLVAFTLGSHAIRRTEHYYLMQLQSKTQIKRPAKDKAQFFPIWVTWDEALEHLTFEAEQEWIRRARRKLEQYNYVKKI